MERKTISIYVIPTEKMTTTLSVRKYGRVLSTREKINANKVEDGYSVLYPALELAKIEPEKLAASLVGLFQKNLPGTALDFVTDGILDDDDCDDLSWVNDFLAVESIIAKAIVPKMANISWERGDDFQSFLDGLTDDDEDDEFDGCETDDEDEEEPDNPFVDIMGNYNDKKSKKDYYGRSRVFKNSKSPKKEFNRHGVIIAQDKSDINKDEKIIKEFLKDFIPGKQGWKKELRKELTERWLRVYTVSKKQLKSLERDVRKHASNKRKSKTTKKALRMTKKLFSVPIDSWSDPNK